MVILVTGEKNRGTTQEKLWNNQDKQLTTPKHDEMILWLLNKKNAIEIIPKLRTKLNRGFINTAPVVQEVKDVIGYCAECGFQIDSNALNILKRIPEKGMRTILSKIDPSVLIILDSHIDFMSEVSLFDIKIESEVPIMSRNFIIGYLDILVTVNPIFLQYAIEVKPKITSFGETLRQLNTYREYFKNAEMFLFTCDMAFKSAFESQGIAVLKYDQ